MLLPQSLRSKRLLVSGICVTVLLATVLYSFGDVSVTPLPSEPLWAFLGESSTDSVFDFLDEARIKRNTFRRASWGALSQQGTKHDMRQNLRDDKQYFTAYNAAG